MGVPDGGILTGLQLFLDIDHTFIGDLEGTLRHTLPDGTVVSTVLLFDDLFGAANGYNARLRDDAIVDLDNAGLIDDEVQGDYSLPDGSFFPLLDTFVAGGWSLIIEDDQAGDDGTINSWSLRFFFGSTTPFAGA
jgi:hypothetical protein